MAYQIGGNPLESFTRARQASEEELRAREQARLQAEERVGLQMQQAQQQTAQMAEESAARQQAGLFGLGEKAVGAVQEHYDKEIEKKKIAEERAYKEKQLQAAQDYETTKTSQEIAGRKEIEGLRGAAELAAARIGAGSRENVAKNSAEAKAEVAQARAEARRPSDIQQGAAGFANRMLQAEQIVGDLEKGGYTVPSRVDQFTAGGKLLGGLASAEGQQFDQAKRNFISSVLRKESGAAISNTEYENEEKKYFPMPGDEPGVIAQKKAARQLAIQNMTGSAGPAAGSIQTAQQPPAVSTENAAISAPLPDWKTKIKQKMPASR